MSDPVHPMQRQPGRQRWRAAFTASKHATAGLISQIDVEAAGHGVRVDGVAPGGVKTGMAAAYVEDPGVSAFIRQATPLGRWAEPQEVADAVLFVACDEACCITGTVLRVDGGLCSK